MLASVCLANATWRSSWIINRVNNSTNVTDKSWRARAATSYALAYIKICEQSMVCAKMCAPTCEYGTCPNVCWLGACGDIYICIYVETR